MNQNIEPGPCWFTRRQLAERYQVHPRTIDEWRRLGYLPAACIGTRLIRFDVTACDHWFNKFRHTAKWEQKEGGAR